MRTARQVLISVVLCILSSCGEPCISEKFVGQSSRDEEGRYCFTLDMKDSLHSNTLYIYTLIDASRKRFGEMPPCIPLQIEAVSPSGMIYGEQVGFPVDRFVVEVPFSRQYEVLYRDGFVPSEYGQWQLFVTVPGEERFSGFRGIGLKHITQKELWEKTN